MKVVINEDFKDFSLTEFPYDHNHTAVGEYQYVKYDGYYGNFYDPISLHQYRSLDGSWLVTEALGTHYMEQNRGDNSSGAFKNVYSCLVHKTNLFSSFVLEYDIRIFELKHYCGMAFNYITSRNYYAVGMLGEEVCIFRRNQENINILSSGKVEFDDLHTYHFKVEISNDVKVYVDNKFICLANISFIQNTKVALVAKSACRYSNILVSMSDVDYIEHLNNKKKEENRLIDLQNSYPKLKCIKKINLSNFGSGRQLRIRNVDGRVIFVIGQHQKRMIRDSFARLSCLTAFDLDGNVLWQIGEANNSVDNTLISCDLPFQIADINNDGKFEVIYSMDFEVRIIDLISGKLIKKMPTPIIHSDPFVKNEPFYRLNVDQIRVADFEGLGYKGDFIIKDRYQNVWAYDHNMKLLWRYHHKNTGHFPYIYDFDNDGKDEMLVGYDMIDDDGKMLWSLPMNSDHTDEIIYARLNKNEPKRFVLASGNEGLNIVNIDGTIYKHNEIGHAQRISVAKYNDSVDGMQICATAFWGSDGIVCMYDCHGNLLREIEMQSNGNVITPVAYDGTSVLVLLNSSSDGGLANFNLDKVVKFPSDNHPTLACEVYDIDNDGIDEILCFDQKEMWIYKAETFKKSQKYVKYTDDGFSNYRGEYLLDEE